MEDLIERYTENLMRAAFSMGFTNTDAEELVQATFVAFLEGGSRFQKKSKLLTYLFGILYNKAREVWRVRNRTESLDAKIDAHFDSYFDDTEHWNKGCEAQMSEVEAKAQSAEIVTAVRDCMEGLSALMRMAFTMKEVERLDSKHVCEALGLTPSNLGVTLFRARNKLRDCLNAKGSVIV